MRVLVTGAQGFLGAWVCQVLAERGHMVLAQMRSPPRQSFAVPDVLVAELLDPKWPEQLKQAAPQAIVHCAAMSGFSECEQQPTLAWANNRDICQSLLAYSAQHASYLIQLSTDLVFDGNPEPGVGGFVEQDIPRPVAQYSRSKYAAEQTCALTPRTLVLRSSLMFGTALGQRPGPSRWLEQSLKQGQQVSLFDDEWRTPLHVQDVAQVIAWALQEQPHGILHVAGQQRVSRVEFGLAYAQALGLSLERARSLILATSRSSCTGPARPKDVSLSTNLLRSLCPQSPRLLQQALRESGSNPKF